MLVGGGELEDDVAEAELHAAALAAGLDDPEATATTRIRTSPALEEHRNEKSR